MSKDTRINILKEDERLLILGFFNRGNIGDEAFIKPYQILFPSSVLTFQSIDDLDKIPSNTTAVIIAGGDVINDYFMKQIGVLLRTYKGPCYAFSVGIPFNSEVKYTNLFDHLTLRTKEDFHLTSNYVGVKNVDYLPDITWLLKPLVTNNKHRHKRLQFAFCLAQPAFYKNNNEKQLVDSIQETIIGLLNLYDCDINLVAFNTSSHPQESDYVINKKLEKRLASYSRVHNITDKALCNPLEMLNYLKQQDLVIGMRFHSIQFSMILNVPFIALYVTKKVNNLLTDFGLREFGYSLEKDTTYRPVKVDSHVVYDLVEKRLSTDFEPIHVNLKHFDLIKKIVDDRKRKQLLVRFYIDKSLQETLLKCKDMIKKYLEIDDVMYERWNNGEINTSTMLQTNKSITILDLARIICFGITNKVGTPFIWGLRDNMLKSDFSIEEAIKWIYEDYVTKGKELEEQHMYYPIMNLKKNIIIDMNYMCQDNYQGLHRSGWSYVIAGLQHLDYRHVLKTPELLVDTCLERTFLWGINTTRVANIIPYKQPWVGFVHHTFNTSYSEFNCNTLLQTPEFLKSLPMCKCIFTLAKTLKNEFIEALEHIGFGHVPVQSLVHPTEIQVKHFSMHNLLHSMEPKVINIGAWLRNPYTIYALQMPKPNSEFALRKCSLQGKEMDNYFLPESFFEKLENFLEHNFECDSISSCLCRPGCSSLSRTNDISNKHIQGMVNFLKQNNDSVKVLSYVNDEDFDDIMSSSIVFLDYVDQPAASNTICECIVRNTPIIVNRYPSLEELLGKDYPGFYDSLYEAVSKILNLDTISQIHEYLKHINKDIFKLEYFVNDFQDKLCAL